MINLQIVEKFSLIAELFSSLRGCRIYRSALLYESDKLFFALVKNAAQIHM